MLNQINLQLFAGEGEDTGLESESLVLEVPDESVEETPSEESDQQTSEEEKPQETREDESKKSDDKFTTDNRQWQKRLERAERSFERKFMEEASSLSDGVKIERGDIPRAARLWNYLKLNPEISSKVQTLLEQESSNAKPLSSQSNNPFSSSSREGNEYEERLNLKEAKIDLKLSDPVFKKYESQILEWAEDNEIEIRSPKQLQLAYKAWKGENSALLMANAEAQGQKKALEQKDAKASAKLAGKAASPVSAPKIDYRKASAKQVLEAEGLSLFKDE